MATKRRTTRRPPTRRRGYSVPAFSVSPEVARSLVRADASRPRRHHPDHDLPAGEPGQPDRMGAADREPAVRDGPLAPAIPADGRRRLRRVGRPAGGRLAVPVCRRVARVRRAARPPRVPAGPRRWTDRDDAGIDPPSLDRQRCGRLRPPRWAARRRDHRRPPAAVPDVRGPARSVGFRRRRARTSPRRVPRRMRGPASRGEPSHPRASRRSDRAPRSRRRASWTSRRPAAAARR